jgi:hypothetical protein
MKGAGTEVRPNAPQKVWLASAFRLEIPAVDCRRVRRIDALTIKIRPGHVEFPNIHVTLLERGSETWSDWFRTFVVDGRGTDNLEKEGAIVFFSQDLKTELGRIRLHHLGISALRYNAPEPMEDASRLTAPGDLGRSLIAELYCESMELVW